MPYIVTLDPDTDGEVSWEVLDEDIYRVLSNAFPPYGKLRPGEAIMIRRADYLDTKPPTTIQSERPRLTLIQGG